MDDGGYMLENEKLHNQLYRFEYVMRKQHYKVNMKNNEYYISSERPVTSNAEGSVLSELELSNANEEFLKIGESLQEKGWRISDIYGQVDYLVKGSSSIVNQIESFVNNYGVLDILRGILSPIFSLEPYQKVDAIKQLTVMRPDDYLIRKYAIDGINSDFYADPTFYRKSTKEIKSYIEERKSIRTDIIEAIHIKYKNSSPLISIEELLPVFFPLDCDKVLSSIGNRDEFERNLLKFYHEPLWLFALCAKLYKLFWDGMGYYIKEYSKSKDDVLSVIPFITNVDFEVSPFQLMKGYRTHKSQPNKDYRMGFKHRFINLFEAMQATYIKQLIYKDTYLIVCKHCGKVQYMSKSNAQFCSSRCKDNFSESEKFIYS
jgi:hypothetical protein